MRQPFVIFASALVLLSTRVYAEDTLTGTMEVHNLQTTSFEGVFDFTIKDSVVGWKGTISFNVPVTSISMYDGDPISHSPDGKTWVFVNKNNKSVFKTGSTLELKFNAQYTGPDTPTGTVVIQNMGHDNWTVPEAPDTDGSKYNYNDLLFKSLLFYEAQRSGKLPANKRIPWRGDSALNDKGDKGEDLTGGWYDAGDHVKFNFPMAYSATAQAWGYLEFTDAYKSTGQEDYLLDGIKWALDYLIKCHTGPEELYVQVGDAGQDHGFWGPPEMMTMPRPAYKITAAKPGSDVAMETAAAMAAGYLVFKTKDPTYAATLLEHAKELWEFGNKYHGRYTDSVSAASGFYTSNNYTDELGWGSLWLHKATNDAKYLAEAVRQFDPDPAWGQSWDEKIVGNQILLYQATKDDKYKTAVENSFKSWFPGGKVPYTPKGLAFRLQWGSLRYSFYMQTTKNHCCQLWNVENAPGLAMSPRLDSLMKPNVSGTFDGKRRKGTQKKFWTDNMKAWTDYGIATVYIYMVEANMAMAALVAAEAGIMSPDLRHWAMCQIHYAIGDTGFSYVVGFGDKSPHSPHHRSSSCPSPPAPCGSDVFNSGIPNVHILYGAMVGGPGSADDYKDDRTNYVNNEVACDYNAGFQGAVAGLKHLMLTGDHPEKTGNAVCPYTSGTIVGR